MSLATASNWCVYAYHTRLRRLLMSVVAVAGSGTGYAPCSLPSFLSLTYMSSHILLPLSCPTSPTKDKATSDPRSRSSGCVSIIGSARASLTLPPNSSVPPSLLRCGPLCSCPRRSSGRSNSSVRCCRFGVFRERLADRGSLSRRDVRVGPQALEDGWLDSYRCFSPRRTRRKGREGGLRREGRGCLSGGRRLMFFLAVVARDYVLLPLVSEPPSCGE